MRRNWILVLALAACGGGGGGDDDVVDAPPGTAALVIEGGPFDVGLVERGTTADVTATIRNTGTAATPVALTTDDPALAVIADDCSALAPGATCTATLRLSVTAAGPVSHELRAQPGTGTAVTAAVAAIGGYRLAVNFSGVGDGRVTSTPAGLDCTASCDAVFPAGPVTLSASFVAPSSFLGWTGAGCTGDGDCVITLDASTSVVAAFLQPVGLRVGIAGSGAGVVRVVGSWPVCATPDCIFEITDHVTYTLQQQPIAESTFQGWSGCTPNPDGTCSVLLDGVATVTATYQAPPTATWVRSSTFFNIEPVDMALTAAGIVTAGTGYFFVGGGAPWVVHHTADGTPGPVFLDEVTPLRDRGLAVANGPGTDVWVLVEVAPATPAAAETLALHRLTAGGAMVFDVAPGGTAGTHGLAVDAAGNAYVSGLTGTTPYIASYSPAGVERWRITPPVPTRIEGLAVRGNLLAAAGTVAGTSRDDGWIGTYDLGGAPGWSRPVAGTLLASRLALDDIAIDADGDVVYGGLDRAESPLRYTTGVVPSGGGAAPWEAVFMTHTTGTLSLRDDDTLAIWVGSAASATAPSRVVYIDEAGNQTATVDVAAIPTPGALAVDDAGHTYLAGVDPLAGFPAIIRRP